MLTVITLYAMLGTSVEAVDTFDSKIKCELAKSSYTGQEVTLLCLDKTPKQHFTEVAEWACNKPQSMFDQVNERNKQFCKEMTELARLSS